MNQQKTLPTSRLGFRVWDGWMTVRSLLAERLRCLRVTRPSNMVGGTLCSLPFDMSSDLQKLGCQEMDE